MVFHNIFPNPTKQQIREKKDNLTATQPRKWRRIHFTKLSKRSLQKLPSAFFKVIPTKQSIMFTCIKYGLGNTKTASL